MWGGNRCTSLFCVHHSLIVDLQKPCSTSQNDKYREDMSCASLPFSLSIFFFVFTVLWCDSSLTGSELLLQYIAILLYTSWNSSSAGCLVFLSWVIDLRQLRQGRLAGLESNLGLLELRHAAPCLSISYLVLQKPTSDRVYRMSRRVIHAAISCRTDGLTKSIFFKRLSK
jgi:hypothetical protein